MIENIAVRSSELSLANLKSVINRAVEIAAEPDDEILEEVFELRHGERKEYGSEYVERISRHEAGHAYIDYLNGNTPSYLTIVARSNHNGYSQLSIENSPLQTKKNLLDRICMFLGGIAAELVCYGGEDEISTGPINDLEMATHIAKFMLINCGMYAGFGLASISRKEAEKMPMNTEMRKEINMILKEQMDKAMSLIQAGREEFDKLVETLKEKEKLTREEIEMALSDQVGLEG
jgi:ATP-dependent Zn protease